MKIETQQPIPAINYYHHMWRMHCVRLIAVLALLSNCIVWAIVAAFYGRGDIAIWLGCGAVFFTFVAYIKANDVNYYHDKYLRAMCDGSILNAEPTE
jgi:hypothetical protein